MPRRVSLPGAAELFRGTPPTPQTPAGEHHPSAAASAFSPPVADVQDHRLPESREDSSRDQTTESVHQQIDQQTDPAVRADPNRRPSLTRTQPAAEASPRGSGRVRHDEKITVYVSSDELLDVERARLMLRADHGMAVDRGRIVREALALVIGDLAERGADSDLVRRLSQP